MNLKEVKNILKNSKYLSKTKIEDEVEINGTISLWNRNDVDIIIEFDDENDINFSEDTLKLIEDKLDWIDKNKKLICKTFIEDEGMFYGLNDEIEKQLSKILNISDRRVRELFKDYKLENGSFPLIKCVTEFINQTRSGDINLVTQKSRTTAFPQKMPVFAPYCFQECWNL